MKTNSVTHWEVSEQQCLIFWLLNATVSVYVYLDVCIHDYNTKFFLRTMGIVGLLGPY